MKIFKEEQRFTQSWLVIIPIIALIIPLCIGIYGITQQIFLKQPFGDQPMSDAGLLFFTFVMLCFSILIFIFKLSCRIDENGIHYQFFPMHFSTKTIKWSELKTAKVRTYLPLSEYGGWGFRSGFFGNKAKGKAFNVSGDVGIQLEFKNGKKLLIGTQKKEEAKRVLETYQNKII
ncbi:hypothetical protein MC378_13220 [Polaribacter sp. MSW13]|uniref:Uncharacterized protein n=1 Tax=Polaribacter marinus TaxID=2916838 RepID=A0A9X1VQ27_9FLAO|nr:hypothetical protein [Polaribacter marinus]MCI2230133.1 hypothetical protein [Polaribacter marinus]